MRLKQDELVDELLKTDMPYLYFALRSVAIHDKKKFEAIKKDIETIYHSAAYKRDWK